MDEESMSLKIAGPLLGKLFHESYCNEGHCGGMLFGETVSVTRNEITDSDHTTSVHSTICVQDYQPLSQKRSFFALQQSDPNLISNCVGFYKIRVSSSRLTMLEKSMHKKLCRECLKNDGLQSRNRFVTLLITYDEGIDMSCLSWKIRAYVWESTGEFSMVKVDVTNLQGSVLNSYITNPNPISDVSSSGANAILETFQSSVMQGTGKITLVESTRKVTSDLVDQLEKTVDELGRHQSLLKNCYKEKVRLLEELDLLTAEMDDAKHRKTHVKISPQLHSRELFDASNNAEAAATLGNSLDPNDDYQHANQQSFEDMKLRSPVVVLEKLTFPREMHTASSSQSQITTPRRRMGSTNSSVKTDSADTAGSEDLMKFDDVA